MHYGRQENFEISDDALDRLQTEAMIMNHIKTITVIETADLLKANSAVPAELTVFCAEKTGISTVFIAPYVNLTLAKSVI